MRLDFYGTGASEGFPAVFCECGNCERARALGGKNLRSRASVGIDGKIIIDFGPDSYAHMLYGSLRPKEIEHILFTHAHRDHFYPAELVSAAPPFAIYHRERVISAYGSQKVAGRLADTVKEATLPYLKISAVSAGGAFSAGDYRVTPMRADHNPGEECLVYLVEKDGKSVFYGLDSAFYPEETWELLKGFKPDCVVMDCTCGAGPAVFPGHMGLVENLRVKERMLKEGIATEKTIFVSTHFAHGFAPFHEDFTGLFAREGIIAAYDGMSLYI